MTIDDTIDFNNGNLTISQKMRKHKNRFLKYISRLRRYDIGAQFSQCSFRNSLRRGRERVSTEEV